MKIIAARRFTFDTLQPVARFSLIRLFAGLVLMTSIPRIATAASDDFAPPPDERQLPKRMHSAMEERPRITVGQSSADLVGADQRALQAAVDYVAALGGGTVEIEPGTYAMRDSLHLRPHVTVRGVKGQTILRKGDAVSSPLVRDGDYGEEQATVQTPAGFDVGCGVAIWDKNAGGFHMTVARITGRNGDDGLYLCWRVRHGVFQDNVLEGNGRFGISIGHKDSDNLIRRNQIRLNEEAGVYFRNESAAMAGHRNRLEENVIENNGVAKEAPGIRVRGKTQDLQFTGNVIRDTRSEGEQKQKVGVLIEEEAGAVALDNNLIDAKTKIEDRRKGVR